MAVSPKNDDFKATVADEVRIAVNGKTTLDFLKKTHAVIVANDYFLSPVFSDGSPVFLPKTLKLLGEAKAQGMPWRMSIQAHKLAGIR